MPYEIQQEKSYEKAASAVFDAAMTARVTPQSESASAIRVEIYPIDPVGRKRMFGARKGVSQTVMTWFFAHLEHHLEK